MIVESDRPGPPFVVEEEADLPLLVVTDAVGRELRAYIARAGSAARVRFTPDDRRAADAAARADRLLLGRARRPSTCCSSRTSPRRGRPSSPRSRCASSDYPGAFASWAGTSMAAPAVTGVVALMRERHPAWTPAQIRAALIGSAVPAYADSNATVEASPLRTGGGFVDAAGAVAPGVLADPPVLAFGLQQPGRVGDGARERERRGRRRRRLAGHDRPPRRLAAGRRRDGARARWRCPPGGRSAAARDADRRPPRPSRATPRATWCSRRARARGASRTGHTSSGRTWPTASARLLSHPGIVRGSTRGQPNRVERYRYPAYTGALGLAGALARGRGALPLPPRRSERSTSA